MNAYPAASNSDTLVRIVLGIAMISLFIGSVMMIIEAKGDDSKQDNNKLWFGVAQLIFVTLMGLFYAGRLVLG